MKTLHQGRYVAFLRGINVGGKNKLPMKDLATIFAEAGGKNVQTFIQSGNVIFSAVAKVAGLIPARTTAAITQQFGFQVPVVVRSAEELVEAVQANPFIKSGVDETACHLMFLASEPDASLVRRLDADRSPPDRFVVRGKDIYLHLPQGAAKTKLSNAYFDSRLKTVSTVRNWRTVSKLVELVSQYGYRGA